MMYVGFFRELVRDENEAYSRSIHEAIRQRGSYPAESVAQYIDNGHPILDVMEGVVDVVGGKFTYPGGSSILTDGVHAWRADLASYVRHYKLALAEAFLAHVSSHGYAVPPISRDKLIDITHVVTDDLGFREA